MSLSAIEAKVIAAILGDVGLRSTAEGVTFALNSRGPDPSSTTFVDAAIEKRFDEVRAENARRGKQGY